MATMPEDSPLAEGGAPLDGVIPPTPDTPASAASAPGPQIDAAAQQQRQQQMLMMILACVGVFLVFYIGFAFYLMASLPAPDGGGQQLKAFGNMLYGTVSGTSVLLIGALGFVLFRRGTPPAAIAQMLVRPGVVVLIVLGIAGMVFATINQRVRLSIDILEPRSFQGLTAPVSVTFGTDSLRTILKKSSLFPRRYRWDFDGDGNADANTQNHQVTTTYLNKGTYRVGVRILLSDGSIESASTTIAIPYVIFGMTPKDPIVDEEVVFDLSNIITSPADVQTIVWDFDGDGEGDAEGPEVTRAHTFTTLGTQQVNVTVVFANGLRESFARPVKIVAEREQPFDVTITSEDPLAGSAPLGIRFAATIPEEIRIFSVEWDFGDGTQKTGETVSHSFEEPKDYEVTVTVTDVNRERAKATTTVTVLEQLELRDLVVTGTPAPDRSTIKGRVPLEVKLNPRTNTPFVEFSWEQENASRVFSTKDDFFAVYNEPGTYPLVLIARDDQSREQRFSYEIVASPPRSNVNFTAVPPTGIVPLTVSFDASQSYIPDQRITGFAWTFGDEEQGEQPKLLGAQVSHRYDTEGTYKVVVRALTEEGKTYEANKTIVVRSASLDACFFPSRTEGTAPMGVRFDARCSTGDVESFLWDFGDGTTNEQAEPVQDHIFQQPGTYTVRLEVSDADDKISNNTVIITVSAP